MDQRHRRRPNGIRERENNSLPFFGLFVETVRDHFEYAQHLFSRYGAVLGGLDALFDVGYLSRKQDTMSDGDMREAGIAVHKAVWDNSFKGAALGDGGRWSSLEHSIGKYAGQLGDYRANLRALDGSKKTEVGILVKISGSFSDLILFNEGEIASNRNGLLPLSDGFFERQGILLRSGTRCIFL